MIQQINNIPFKSQCSKCDVDTILGVSHCHMMWCQKAAAWSMYFTLAAQEWLQVDKELVLPGCGLAIFICRAFAGTRWTQNLQLHFVNLKGQIHRHWQVQCLATTLPRPQQWFSISFFSASSPGVIFPHTFTMTYWQGATQSLSPYFNFKYCWKY